jgi:hypothetical protein
MAGCAPHRHHPSFVIVGNIAHHRRQRCASSSASLRIILKHRSGPIRLPS